jgi:hypothetical protein
MPSRKQGVWNEYCLSSQVEIKEEDGANQCPWRIKGLGGWADATCNLQVTEVEGILGRLPKYGHTERLLLSM